MKQLQIKIVSDAKINKHANTWCKHDTAVPANFTKTKLHIAANFFHVIHNCSAVLMKVRALFDETIL